MQALLTRTFLGIGLVLLAAGVESCTGGGSSAPALAPRAAALATASPTPAPSATPLAPAPAVTGGAKIDDWTMYAHDSQRTGYQAQDTGLSVATVPTLTMRWRVSLGENIMASPLVANGLVYVAGLNGTIRALSTATGATVWSNSIGTLVQMTPTLADGLLFVGNHATPATFAALDAATGVERWSVTLPGADRSEPVVVDGVVYVGDASGDEPFCNQGSIRGFNEMTGAPTVTWFDDPTPDDGGGIWGPLSTDGTSLYFGTGNTCSPNVSDANAAVKLSTAGAVEWVHNQANPLSDDDVGTSLMLSKGGAIGSDKNGTFFDFDTATGTIAWSDHLGLLDGFGAVGSPSTDGNLIVTDGGYINNPQQTPNDPGGMIYGLTAGGSVLWKFDTDDEVRGVSAINNGVVYTSMNDGIFAHNELTGAPLWSYSFGTNQTYGSPAIVPSGLYDVDDGGNVYAFGLGDGTGSAATLRSKHSVRRL